MDFDLTAEQTALRERAEVFCREHCTEADAAMRDRDRVYPESLHRALAASGLLAACLPAAYGGGAGGPVEWCLVNEVLARHSAAAMLLLLANGITAALITLGGSEAQKERYLPGVGDGRVRFAFALTEPGAGSDTAAISTRAVRLDDGYVVEGTKLYTTAADTADFILTVVRTRPDGTAAQGTSLLAVPRRMAGVRVTPLDKIAVNGVAACRVQYDDVQLPLDACVGTEDGAWSLLTVASSLERLAVAAASAGMAQAILDDVTTHGRAREQFGRPLSQFQAIQHQLADMASEVDAMRLLTYRAAWLTARGRVRPKEVSMAKLYASERLIDIAVRGMRLLGGRAYFTDSPMPRRLREALLTLYMGETAEIQRNVVAKGMGL